MTLALVEAERNSSHATAETRPKPNLLILRKPIYILFLSMLASSVTQAQIGKSMYAMRDSRLDKLVDKQIELNRLSAQGRMVVEEGYRLLVVNTNKRDQAMETKARLLKLYPDQKSYLSYQSPNFKLHMGNFKSYKEAEKFREEMASNFGGNILIIPSPIEIRVGKWEMTNNQ
jgi:hypothetical protein